MVLPFLDLKKGFEITGRPVKNEEVWRALSSAYESEGIEVDLGKDDSTLRKTNQISAMEMMTPFRGDFRFWEPKSQPCNQKGLAALCLVRIKTFLEDHHFRQYRKKLNRTSLPPLRLGSPPTVSLSNLGVNYGVDGRASIQPVWATNHFGPISEDPQPLGGGSQDHSSNEEPLLG